MEKTLVMYPSAGIGHIISMIELAKLILHRHSDKFTSIHILITTGRLDIKASYFECVSRKCPSIIFHHFPFVQPTTSSPNNLSKSAIIFEFLRLNASNARTCLQEISRTSRICSFIIDVFCSSAMPIADELGIPTYYFFTSGLAALAFFLYFPTINKQIDQNLKDLPQTDQLQIPGLPPIRAIHMPEPVLTKDDPAYSDMVYFTLHLQKAKGILVNTFDELEPITMEAIDAGLCVPDGPTPPIYNIGPLIADVDSGPYEDGNTCIGMGSNQNECLSWLDKQPNQSVVFLCFGSRGFFTVGQLKEIAIGLEKSGQRFLLVVKKPPEVNPDQAMGFELGDVLPEGFQERTKNRGLVVKSWAPQVEVLMHDAVGVFVSHCGWNSSLEAILAGVPVVAWPLYAEQHINRAALVHYMKLAVELEHTDNDGSFVFAEEVERKIRELMDSESGREFREQSAKMKEMASNALGDVGSSTTALSKVVQLWLNN